MNVQFVAERILFSDSTFFWAIMFYAELLCCCYVVRIYVCNNRFKLKTELNTRE